MAGLLQKLLSIGSDKDIKEFRGIANQVSALEDRFRAMDDEELQGCTGQFRARLEAGESLDELLPEAFAAVREASARTTGLRHFDVQIIGGIALHRGTVAEMKTGEGKTLVSTLAGYLNALPGKGVHIVTVNDYLAKRDSEWMGRIYRFLGLEVGLIQNGMKVEQKRKAYAADVTYGTNTEFGFDYLRDNMVQRPERRVQRGHHYAIVDEADSILIDEARTPLIISGRPSKSAATYKDFARAVRGLQADRDYEMNEARHTIAATEIGLKKIERALGIDDLYADESGQLVNHLQQALKAEYMFHRDQQYVVLNGEVKIVDEFTGRIMEGRRYSEGLHQAIEAKEGVYVKEENQTIATITLQNYFLMYDKLAGMTGTALTEDAEFREVYHVGVEVVPPNKPVIRIDHNDQVYRTIDAKFAAVADDVEARHRAGQPCLVGTVSVESSERLSRILQKRGISHNILNAKYHEREAQIIAQAGRKGAVTIATNMAGRGTDILLGGNPDLIALDFLREAGIEPEEAEEEQLAEALASARAICAKENKEVIAAGGLCVIGTERHESRRIDNQLRGRSGRQGDPGESRFYLSLEDELLRLFAGDRLDRIAGWMQKAQIPEDVPIEAKMVSKAVESAQRKVEEVNFAMRKNVLDYDNVMNTQRSIIYEERNRILDGKDLTQRLDEIIKEVADRRVPSYVDEKTGELDTEGLSRWLELLTGIRGGLDFSGMEDPEADEVADTVASYIRRRLEEKAARLGPELMQALSSQVMLRVIDTRWMAYLQEMDYLKTGIGLRGYGQRDPLVEYKNEAYLAFTELVDTMYEDFLRTILRLELVLKPQAPESSEEGSELKGATLSGPADPDGGSGTSGLRHARTSAATGAGGATGAASSGQVRVAQGGATARSGQASHSGQPGQAKPRTYRKAEDSDPYANVGRNDPCPCGSGKKFKKCHGRNR